MGKHTALSSPVGSKALLQIPLLRTPLLGAPDLQPCGSAAQRQAGSPRPAPLEMQTSAQPTREAQGA